RRLFLVMPLKQGIFGSAVPYILFTPSCDCGDRSDLMGPTSCRTRIKDLPQALRHRRSETAVRPQQNLIRSAGCRLLDPVVVFFYAGEFMPVHPGPLQHPFGGVDGRLEPDRQGNGVAGAAVDLLDAPG